MKQESSAVFWALGILVLILAGVGSLFIWEPQPEAPETAFIATGEITGYAGGTRRVVIEVTLEVADAKSDAQISERLDSARAIIAETISEYTDDRLYSAQGKQELQQSIQSALNDLFGDRTVRDVMLTSFLLSVS